jgi:hypothetical protein
MQLGEGSRCNSGCDAKPPARGPQELIANGHVSASATPGLLTAHSHRERLRLALLDGASRKRTPGPPAWSAGMKITPALSSAV